VNLKPWMLNGRMWASGTKVNNWKIPKGWLQFGWFTTRNPEQWTKDQTDYFDYTFAIMIQHQHGWN
jgi:hypothetical protein